MRYALLLSSLLALLTVAACDGGDARDNVRPDVPVDEVKASFPPGGLVDVIQVDAIDRLALRSAVLIAPDGATTPAQSLEANRAPAVAGGSLFANSPFSDKLSGLQGGGRVTATASATTAFETQNQLLAVISQAMIPLPDPVAYRRDWQHYRIRLQFGDAPRLETREIPTPEPAAEAKPPPAN